MLTYKINKAEKITCGEPASGDFVDNILYKWREKEIAWLEHGVRERFA